MSPIEIAILEIFIQRVMLNQPLNVAKGLELCNSLIKVGSSLEMNVINYIQRRGQHTMDGSRTKNPGNLLGIGYWNGFRRRYRHKLVSKKGVQFGHNRSDCYYF